MPAKKTIRSAKPSANRATTPRRHISVAKLAQLIGCFRQLGYDSCSIRVRTVAFRLEREWHNFATAGALELGSAQAEKRIQLRDDVVLFELCAPVKRPPSVEEIRQWFCRWREVLKSPAQYPLQQHVYLDRQPSENEEERWPQWRTELREQGRDHKSFSPPDGPFLHEQENIFAPNLPLLSAYFLRSARWAQEHSATNANVLVIPDRRVRLADVSIKDNVISASVERNTKADLRLCVHAISHTNIEFREVVRINRHAKASLELPFAPAELSLWITLADGYPLDQYIESLRRDAWSGRRGLLRASPQGEVQRRLLQVLQEGESDRVEFKPYVSFRKPTEKRDELLQTVCGFANAKGGSLYIGVSNNAVPEGIELGLREYNAVCKGSEECLKESYMRDLQKLFAEGITPSIPLEYEWHEIAHHWILEVKTPTSPETVGLLDGNAYERVGATNRKILIHQVSKARPKNSMQSAFGFTADE